MEPQTDFPAAEGLSYCRHVLGPVDRVIGLAQLTEPGGPSACGIVVAQRGLHAYQLGLWKRPDTPTAHVQALWRMVRRCAQEAAYCETLLGHAPERMVAHHLATYEGLRQVGPPTAEGLVPLAYIFGQEEYQHVRPDSAARDASWD